MKRIVMCTSLAALALAACGSDDSGIAIEGAWARTSAEGQTTGAVYFDITADEADRLVAVSVPTSVAAEAQIHEVVMAEQSDDGEMDMGDDMSDDMGDDMGDDMSDEGEMDMGDMDPQMRMQQLVDGLPLPAGETVTLEPGGYHIMLLDLAEPLEVGDEIEVTLDFENADDMNMTVEVAESAP
jgi:copper(I)-binding protein